MARVSKLEESLNAQLEAVNVTGFHRQYRFSPPRRWTFDFAWVEKRLAVEVEGGIFMQGRHSRGVGLRNDAEKYNAASLQGWTVLRFTDREVKQGSALTSIQGALAGENVMAKIASLPPSKEAPLKEPASAPEPLTWRIRLASGSSEDVIADQLFQGPSGAISFLKATAKKGKWGKPILQAVRGFAHGQWTEFTLVLAPVEGE